MNLLLLLYLGIITGATIIWPAFGAFLFAVSSVLAVTVVAGLAADRIGDRQ